MKTGALASVSREGRDTLWLLAVLALIMAPHTVRLPLWCSVGATLGLLWRGHMAWRDSRLPPRWVLLLALIVCVGLTLSTHRALFGREAGVTLVVVLTGLKTLELRARRDAFVVTSLAFFLILTQFLYSQSLLLAALMSLAVWGLMTSLVLAQRPLGRPSLWSVAREAGRTLVWGVPLMVVLFLLFPRIGPLWALPSDAQARTGLSDKLTLGRVAELALDDTIAMRVRFEGQAPPPKDLYFRGFVLDDFDGLTWRSRRPSAQIDNDDSLDTRGPLLRYEVTLENQNTKAIPLLEATVQVRTPAQQTPMTLNHHALSWMSPVEVRERIQLEAQASTRFRHGFALTHPELASWVELPQGFNPRTLAWAQSFQSRQGLSGASPRERAQAVLRYIRQENFSYTLAPGEDAPEAGQPSTLPQRHQIDHFWLDRRAGFCEHFATAFVVVMRAMGVPSRVVTGFQGAEANPVDGLYIVRNSHAHAWAEYWQAGEGWVRADPTAAVAPERIDRSRPLAAPRSGLSTAFPEWNSDTWRRGKALWEATNHRWNVWVLQYSRGSQKQMLGKMGWDANDWADVARVLTMALSSIAMAGVAWLWLTRERTRPSPWLQPMWRVHRALLKSGLPAPAHCPAPAPALNWVQVLHAKPPQDEVQSALIASMVRTLRSLDALRYGPAEPQSKSQARSLVKSIENDSRQWRARQSAAKHRAH